MRETLPNVAHLAALSPTTVTNPFAQLTRSAKPGSDQSAGAKLIQQSAMPQVTTQDSKHTAHPKSPDLSPEPPHLGTDGAGYVVVSTDELWVGPLRFWTAWGWLDIAE